MHLPSVCTLGWDPLWPHFQAVRRGLRATHHTDQGGGRPATEEVTRAGVPRPGSGAWEDVLCFFFSFFFSNDFWYVVLEYYLFMVDVFHIRSTIDFVFDISYHHHQLSVFSHHSATINITHNHKTLNINIYPAVISYQFHHRRGMWSQYEQQRTSVFGRFATPLNSWSLGLTLSSSRSCSHSWDRRTLSHRKQNSWSPCCRRLNTSCTLVQSMNQKADDWYCFYSFSPKCNIIKQMQGRSTK